MASPSVNSKLDLCNPKINALMNKTCFVEGYASFNCKYSFGVQC